MNGKCVLRSTESDLQREREGDGSVPAWPAGSAGHCVILIGNATRP